MNWIERLRKFRTSERVRNDGPNGRVAGEKKPYDVLAYWNSRPDPNNAEGNSAPRVENDVGFIRKHLGSAKHVLDLGPGVGRTWTAFDAGLTVQTLDVARQHAGRLAEIARTRGFSLEQAYLDAPLDRFPFADRRFDVGICCQVFLHQPPEVFAHSIAEFSRVSARLILISGFHSTFPDVAKAAIKADHVFSHDFIAAVQSLGRTITDVQSRGGLLFLHAE